MSANIWIRALAVAVLLGAVLGLLGHMLSLPPVVIGGITGTIVGAAVAALTRSRQPPA